ncbi:hypothetical protein FBY24_1295 [Cellulomonas sp. SLBN-39]|nr:hypothetical protein FBY24_1295 [Cellulomonas sp. SLBN-39]
MGEGLGPRTDRRQRLAGRRSARIRRRVARASTGAGPLRTDGSDPRRAGGSEMDPSGLPMWGRPTSPAVSGGRAGERWRHRRRAQVSRAPGRPHPSTAGARATRRRRESTDGRQRRLACGKGGRAAAPRPSPLLTTLFHVKPRAPGARLTRRDRRAAGPRLWGTTRRVRQARRRTAPLRPQRRPAQRRIRATPLMFHVKPPGLPPSSTRTPAMFHVKRQRSPRRRPRTEKGRIPSGTPGRLAHDGPADDHSPSRWPSSEPHTRGRLRQRSTSRSRRPRRPRRAIMADRTTPPLRCSPGRSWDRPPARRTEETRPAPPRSTVRPGAWSMRATPGL